MLNGKILTVTLACTEAVPKLSDFFLEIFRTRTVVVRFFDTSGTCPIFFLLTDTQLS